MARISLLHAGDAIYLSAAEESDVVLENNLIIRISVLTFFLVCILSPNTLVDSKALSGWVSDKHVGSYIKHVQSICLQ